MLIHQIGLLPRLFVEVFVPGAVLEELSRPETPPEVVPRGLVARQRHVPVIGILGILEISTAQDLVSLPAALKSLRRPGFRMTPELTNEGVKETD